MLEIKSEVPAEEMVIPEPPEITPLPPPPPVIPTFTEVPVDPVSGGTITLKFETIQTNHG